MPQLIEVPNVGAVEFPDDMSDDDIVSAIQKNTPQVLTPENGPQALREQGPSGGPMPPYQNTTEGLTEVVNNPGVIPAFAMGAATAPGKIAYRAAADVVSKVAGHPEYGGNLLYGDRQPWQAAPVDVFLDTVSATNPNLAVAGKVGRSLAEMSPLAAVGMLPSAVAKLAAVGFSADMIAHAPEQFAAFAEEINKPEAEQDPAKLSTLKSDILQTFAFAPLAGAHGVAPALKEIGYALDLARENAGPVRGARGEVRGPRPMMPAEEGAPVPTWDATEALPNFKEVTPNEPQARSQETQGQEGPLLEQSQSPAGARQSDVARSAEAEAAPRAQLPPSPETTPAQTEVAPPRAADTTQAASAPGAGETPVPRSNPEQFGTPALAVLTDQIAGSGSRYITAKVDGQPFEVRISNHSSRGGNVRESASTWSQTRRVRREALMKGDPAGREFPFDVEIITRDPASLTPDDVANLIRKHTDNDFYIEESNILDITPEQVREYKNAPESGASRTIVEDSLKSASPNQIQTESRMVKREATKPESAKPVKPGEVPKFEDTQPVEQPAAPEMPFKAGDKVIYQGKEVTISKAVPGSEFVGIGKRSVPIKEIKPVPAETQKPANEQPAAAEPYMVDPTTGRPRVVNGVGRMQAEVTLNVNEKTLKAGRWPNGKLVTGADRKRLNAENKAYRAVLKELDAQAANDVRILRAGETAAPAEKIYSKAAQPVETPDAAAAKVEEHVADVASGDKTVKTEPQAKPATGPRPAKEIKTELVQRLEEAIKKAPPALEVEGVIGRDGGIWFGQNAKQLFQERRVPQKITIEIPGDGTFTVFNTKETLGRILAEAKKLDTRRGTPPAQLRVNRGGDLAEQARKVYGDDRTAIAKLREQAQNPDLELTPEHRRKLLGAAEAMEAKLPKNIAADRLAQWRADLANATTRLDKATKTFVDFKAEAESLRRIRDDRVAAQKTITSITSRLNAAERAVDRARIDVNQSKQAVAAANERIAREQTVIDQAPQASRGAVGSPPALGGGDLGEAPPQRPVVADDPRHSVFDAVPMEMPEAVQAVKLFTGIYPKIRQNLGRAAGLFRFTQGEAGKGQVELLARIFDLLDVNDKAKLREEARNYAEAEAPNASAKEKARVEEERYQHLLEQAYEEAKRSNPKQAMKVMWHEIGHVVDWLPDRIIRGRGNFFGRIASLKNYLKGVLPLDPDRVGPFQEKPTPGEINKLRKEAYDAAQAEIGPMREIIEKILVEEPIYREAGITVDMVKKLMGMDARETMPELYKWFAEQDGKVKAEIVRAAMKGLVDERLKSVAGAGREQIGTRTIEREVRRREGRPPTPDEVAAKFKELFRRELERRNIAELKTVKAELEPLIAWWRGTAKMERYFATSEEMYAEAFSVFANNPAALEARAPTYAKLIWNYLDRKPQVKALYDQIQTDIKAGTIMPQRVKALWKMWDDNDAHSLEIARDAGKLKGRDVLDNVQYHLDRRFGPVYRAARGVWQGRISTAIGNFLYRMSEHERYLADLNHEVGKRLVAKNLDWSHDLGEYLFHKWIEMERFNMANPLGWTSKNSLERLAEMRTQLGPERWAALEEARAKYREQYEKHVVAELNAAQMFTPELQQVIQERAHYATFAAIKGVADTGIEKLLESRFGASVTPHIFKQVGNLGEIKNPATATVLKGLSLISAAYRNTMKREVVKMLQEQHPEDIMPARTRWNGKAREPVIIDNHRNVGTIVYLDRGQVQAFYVRRVMSDAVNSASGADNLAYSMLLKATGWQKGLFTQLNYGFWPVNFVKDVVGWTMQMPGLATPYYWAKNLPKALIAARQSVTHSKPNPYADAALRRKMLISKGDPRGVWAAAENEYEMKLASFGMDPVQWKGQADGAHRLVKLWDWYKNLGQTVERVNKISGMIYLDEKFPTMPEWKKREIVRERAGSPNFLERGASNPAVDLVALFYNPWKEALRSLGKSARENPWSLAAKGTAAIAMPTVLMSAAVNGWLGDDRKEQYASIPDYDLQNYLCVPLGWVDRAQRKVMYLRLPLWEPARIAHGALFHALTGRGQGIAAHVGAQLPGLNPIWKIGLAWASYAQGKNPVDISRGVPVMPDKVFNAGGPATLAEMAKYTWNEAGGSILNRFKNLNLESAPESEGEKFLSVPGVNNALGRWLKVSDRGLADAQRGVAGEIGQQRAQIQLGVDEILRKLTGEGSWENLQQALKTGDAGAMAKAMAAAALTDSERMLMREPYALEYFTRKFPELVASKANVNARLWFNAQSTEERAKLIQRGIIQPPAR